MPVHHAFYVIQNQSRVIFVFVCAKVCQFVFGVEKAHQNPCSVAVKPFPQETASVCGKQEVSACVA